MNTAFQWYYMMLTALCGAGAFLHRERGAGQSGWGEEWSWIKDNSERKPGGNKERLEREEEVQFTDAQLP